MNLVTSTGVDLGLPFHNWQPHPRMPYLLLQGYAAALVRTEPGPDGRYIWQFRGVASFASTVDEAKQFVEAGAEYFQTFRRNPYGAS